MSENDARADADLFIENLNRVKDKLTGYVFVDVERKQLTKDKEALTRYVNAFLGQLQNHGYTKLRIYSGRSFILDRLVPSHLKGGIVKWIAAYNNKDAGITCDVWQHSSSGVVPGVNGPCDVNISYTELIGKPKLRHACDWVSNIMKRYHIKIDEAQIEGVVRAAYTIFVQATEKELKKEA